MEKIFNIDFRTGSLYDKVSGYLTTINTSYSKFKKGDKGLCLESSYGFTNNLVLPSATYTVEFAARWDFKTYGYWAYVLDFRYEGAGYITKSASTTNVLSISSGTPYVNNVATNIVPINTYSHIMICGITLSCIAGNGYFGSFFTCAECDKFIGDIAYIRIYSGTLTEQERSYAYRDFLNSHPIFSEKFPQQGIINKPRDLSEVYGLAAAYNFIPNGNTVVDISGNGFNLGIIGNPMSNKNGMIFSGNDILYKNSPIISYCNDFTVSFRMKVNRITGYQSILWVNGSSTGEIWIFQVESSIALDQNVGGAFSWTCSLQVNKTYSITINFIKSTHASTLYLNGVDKGTGYSYNPTTTLNSSTRIGTWSFLTLVNELHDLRVYNRASSLQEAKDYHNSFVNIVLIEDFSSEGADGLAKVPSGWSLQSGSFKIGEICGLGKNIVPQASSTFDTDGTAYYSPVRGYVTWDTTNKNMIYTSDDASGENRVYVPGICTIGKYYRVEFDAKSDYASTGHPIIIMYFEDGWETPETHAISSSFQHYIIQGRMMTFNYFYLVLGAYMAPGETVVLDNIVMTEITKLDTMKNRSKYLESLSNMSRISIPCTQSYGTWEFDFKQVSTYSHAFVDFISQYNKTEFYTPSQGYALVLAYNGDYFLFSIRDNAYQSSFFGAKKSNTWYRYKITRQIGGVFKVMMKGGSMAPTDGYDGWTYVDTVTNNSYSSKYFTMTLQAGDCIANIKILDGIIE